MPVRGPTRRAKVADLLTLLVPELAALVTSLGLLSGQGSVWSDAVAVAVAAVVHVACNVLAAFMPLYARVAPWPARR